MQATLTQLHRETARVIEPVIQAGQTVFLTEHGQAKAKITPLRRPNRKAALQALRELGPVELPPR